MVLPTLMTLCLLVSAGRRFYLTTYGYDRDVGLSLGVRWPYGSPSYGYDNCGLPTEITYDKFGGTAYAYDAARSAMKLTYDTTRPTTHAYDSAVTNTTKDTTFTTYTYNARNQLTDEDITGGNTKDYSYDKNGNNTSIVEKSGETTVKTITMTYDTLSRMLTWGDGTNTETTAYRGAEWHRKSVNDGTTATSFLYDGDNVVADYQSGSAVKYYVTPFLDQNLSVTDVSGSSTSYFTADGLGSVRTLSDSSGTLKNRYDFTAFGEKYAAGTSETIPNRYTYTGRETGEVAGAPMYYRNRTYFSDIGRFGRRDPAFSPEWNLYGYVNASPVRWVDPYGLAICYKFKEGSATCSSKGTLCCDLLGGGTKISFDGKATIPSLPFPINTCPKNRRLVPVAFGTIEFDYKDNFCIRGCGKCIELHCQGTAKVQAYYHRGAGSPAPEGLTYKFIYEKEEEGGHSSGGMTPDKGIIIEVDVNLEPPKREVPLAERIRDDFESMFDEPSREPWYRKLQKIIDALPPFTMKGVSLKGQHPIGGGPGPGGIGEWSEGSGIKIDLKADELKKE